MFNKLLLNNQLIANKKIVQKAKTVAINKLVQKIRKLKRLADKTPESTKIREKILKTTEVLSCVKKSKNMEILKKALINEKNLNSIITNGRSLPEEIAEAILLDTKQLIDIVKHIQNLLSLNDEINPGWRNKILELSKKKQKQLRTEQKKEIRQQRKVRHELTLKRAEWLEENLPEKLINHDSPVDTSESKMPSPENETEKKPEKKNNLSKNIKKKANAYLFKTEKILKSDEKVKDDSEQELEIVKSVDPFFITQNGGNYLSTVVIERVQPDGPNDGMIRKERRAYQNDGSRKQQYKKNNFKKGQNFGSSMQILETNNKWKKRNIIQNNIINEKGMNENEEKLHPSWASKQKERGIKEFSGKKIVFDENEEGKLVEKVANNARDKSGKKFHQTKQENGIKMMPWKKKDVESNANNPSKKIDLKSEAKLHPSWEAKQKLKPVISEFKGKKIKFDE